LSADKFQFRPKLKGDARLAPLLWVSAALLLVFARPIFAQTDDAGVMSRNAAGNSRNVTNGSGYVDIPPDSPPEAFYTIIYNQGMSSTGRFGWYDEFNEDGSPVEDFKRTYKLNFQNVQRSFPMAFSLGIKAPNTPLPEPTFTITGAIEKDALDGNMTKPYTAFYMTDSITDSTEVLIEDDLKTVLVGSSPNTEFYRRWSLGRVSRPEPVAITSSELIEIDDMQYALVVPLSEGGDYLSSVDPDTGKPVYNKSLKAVYLHKPDRMKVTLSWEPASAVRVWHTPFKARTDGSDYFDGEIQNGQAFYVKDDENPVFIEIVEFQNAKLRWGIDDRYHEIELLPVEIENLREQNIADAFEVSNVVTNQNLDAQASSNGDLRTYRIKLSADLGSSAKIRFEIYEDGSLVDRNENENGELPISSKSEGGETFYGTDNFRFVTWNTDDAHAGNQTIKVKLGDTVRMHIVVDGDDLTYLELPIGLPPSESSAKAIRTVDTRFVKLDYGSVASEASPSTLIERMDKVFAQGAVRFSKIDEATKAPVKNIISIEGNATSTGTLILLVESTQQDGSKVGHQVDVSIGAGIPSAVAQAIASAINTEVGSQVATSHDTYPRSFGSSSSLPNPIAHVVIDRGQEVIYSGLTVIDEQIPGTNVSIPITNLSNGDANNLHSVALLGLNYGDGDPNTLDVFITNEVSAAGAGGRGTALPHYYTSSNSPIVGGYCIRLSASKDNEFDPVIAPHEAGHILLDVSHPSIPNNLMLDGSNISTADSITATKRITDGQVEDLRSSSSPAMGMLQAK